MIVARADRDTALEHAEALCQSVRALGIEHAGLGAGRVVTISVGVASMVPTRTMEHGALVEAADAALYRAKQNGRDRVEVADSC